VKKLTILLQDMRGSHIPVSIEKTSYIYSNLSRCETIDFLLSQQCIYLPPITDKKKSSTTSRVWWRPDEVRCLSNLTRRSLKESYLAKVIDVHDVNGEHDYNHQQEIQKLFKNLQVPNKLTVKDYCLALENVATLKDTRKIETILTEGE